MDYNKNLFACRNKEVESLSSTRSPKVIPLPFQNIFLNLHNSVCPLGNSDVEKIATHAGPTAKKRRSNSKFTRKTPSRCKIPNSKFTRGTPSWSEIES
mmetsp:Transcript_14170/g.28252  ORF Transcript_14170/g.28252 Transcript_14170/m.28252 type:complete len:98 (+) Transcript_14170:63-356(+)